MKARLQTSLSQRVVLTPQLRQVVRFLQMSNVELEIEINQAIQNNPLLEWNDSSDTSQEAGFEHSETSSADSNEQTHDILEPGLDESPHSERSAVGQTPEMVFESIGESETLKSYLLWQLNLTSLSHRDRWIGAIIIDALEEDGYLRESVSSILSTMADAQVTKEEFRIMLQRIQRFDPVGVACQSLNECLLRQLEALPRSTPGVTIAQAIVEAPLLSLLPRVGVQGLAQKMRQKVELVQTAVDLIKTLSPYPGEKVIYESQHSYIVPDCFIWRERGSWRVALTKNAGSQVRIHNKYRNMLGQGHATDMYLKQHLQEAQWLLKNLHARDQTLLRVVSCALKNQTNFLDHGPKALRPLTIRALAEELQLNESTVSRAIAHKYAHTPHGIISLKCFFSNGIETDAGAEASSISIQSMIRELIQSENPRKPLSDANLAECLKQAGIPIARRTVSKYRELMNIPASSKRMRIA